VTECASPQSKGLRTVIDVEKAIGIAAGRRWAWKLTELPISARCCHGTTAGATTRCYVEWTGSRLRSARRPANNHRAAHRTGCTKQMSDAPRNSVKRDADRVRPLKSWRQIRLSLIGELGQLGFCRPARRFLAVGVRPSGNSAPPSLVVRGARPTPGPATAAKQPLRFLPHGSPGQ
jgi:hypothetical protein